MDGFTLTSSTLDRAWVLHVAGELATLSAPALREYAVAGMVGHPGAAFVLDLRAVGFMDSVGLGVTWTASIEPGCRTREHLTKLSAAVQNLDPRLTGHYGDLHGRRRRS